MAGPYNAFYPQFKIWSLGWFFISSGPRPGCQKSHIQKSIFPKSCYWGTSSKLTGHLNQARFLLGGPNLRAGRPFSLKNDRLGVLGLPARRQAPTMLSIQNTRFRVKVGSLFNQAPGQDVKNPIFKSQFFQNLAIGGLQAS
jgi:hypothetical protein